MEQTKYRGTGEGFNSGFNKAAARRRNWLHWWVGFVIVISVGFVASLLYVVVLVRVARVVGLL